MDYSNTPPIVFIFCGQAVLWKTMALELYNENSVFRESMDKIDNYLKNNYFNGESMLNKLRLLNDDDESPNNNQYLSHSILFMFQVSLFELYKSEGISPSLIYGVSCGEMASLYCSGGVSLKNTCDLLIERARLIDKIVKNCPKGIPFFTSLGSDEFIEKYSKKYSDIEIAGIHTDFSLLMGTTNFEQFDQLFKEFKEKEIPIKRINACIPFHTSAMDFIKDDAFRIKEIKFDENSFTVPTYSSSNGKRYNENNSFNIFKSIRNCLCTKIAIQDIFNKIEINGSKKVIFVELSPHPIASPMMYEIVRTLKSTIFTTTNNDEINPNVISLSSLNKNENDNIVFNNGIKTIKRHINL
ncbi:hypothetical protein RB653_001135 [Dictyostelium firmibasis]|uniref:Malonyl-CoA:ACP transacylase (MAT) domain-containing protein n=1 Tax=Dictyostelium firmibasis TaxID=79012 RepID=A0AAN7YYG3_9MYCE